MLLSYYFLIKAFDNPRYYPFEEGAGKRTNNQVQSWVLNCCHTYMFSQTFYLFQGLAGSLSQLVKITNADKIKTVLHNLFIFICFLSVYIDNVHFFVLLSTAISIYNCFLSTAPSPLVIRMPALKKISAQTKSKIKMYLCIINFQKTYSKKEV